MTVYAPFGGGRGTSDLWSWLTGANQGNSIAKPNRYDFLVGWTRGSATSEESNILCTAVTWPSQQLLSTERRIGATTRKVTYGYANPDIAATFLMDEHGSSWSWLRDWQKQAMPNRDRDGVHYPRYFKEYVKNIEIYQLDKNGNRMHGVKIIDAYPTSLNAMQFGNEQEGLLEVSCEFSYTRFFDIDASGNERSIEMF